MIGCKEVLPKGIGGPLSGFAIIVSFLTTSAEGRIPSGCIPRSGTGDMPIGSWLPVIGITGVPWDVTGRCWGVWGSDGTPACGGTEPRISASYKLSASDISVLERYLPVGATEIGGGSGRGSPAAIFRAASSAIPLYCAWFLL